VWFSQDSGRTWDSVTSLRANTNNYQWTVPTLTTGTVVRNAIVMVYQRNTDNPNSVPPRVTNLVPNEYNLFSNPFMIRPRIVAVQRYYVPMVHNFNGVWFYGYNILGQTYGERKSK
jgi:hypothetical protein